MASTTKEKGKQIASNAAEAKAPSSAAPAKSLVWENLTPEIFQQKEKMKQDLGKLAKQVGPYEYGEGIEKWLEGVKKGAEKKE